jgi:hypothetical protein
MTSDWFGSAMMYSTPKVTAIVVMSTPKRASSLRTPEHGSEQKGNEGEATTAERSGMREVP